MSLLDTFLPFGRYSADWIAARYEPDITGFGEPISSGGNPYPAFDDDPHSFWISPEKGADVRGKAYIGCRFPYPVHIRRVVLEQTTNTPFRQDLVRIQSSADGGQTWRDVTKSPLRVHAKVADIRLPRSGLAAQWRILAAGSNAQTGEHAWTPVRVEMMAAFSYRDTNGRLRKLRSNPATGPSALVPSAGFTEYVSTVRPEPGSANPPAPAAAPDRDGTAEPPAAPDIAATPSQGRHLSDPFDRLAANEMLANGETSWLLRHCEAHAAASDDAIPCLIGGHAARQSGDIDRAVRFWEEAFARDPANDEIACSLLSGLYEADQRDNATYETLYNRLLIDRHSLTYDADNLESQAATKIYRRHGCVLIRGLFSADASRAYRAAMERTLDGIPDGFIHDTRNATYPLNAAFNDSRDGSIYARWQEALDAGMYMSSQFFSDAEREMSDAAAQHVLQGPAGAVVQSFLGYAPVFSPNLSMARAYTRNTTSFTVTGHQDSRLQHRHELFSTVWIPFTRCGPTSGSGLGVLPVRLNNYLPTDNNKTDLVDRELLPNEMFFDPEFEPGDGLFHSTHSLHRTVTMLGAPHSRLSVDFRFVSAESDALR